MNETAIVEFQNLVTGEGMELEVPLNITANDLVLALNETFALGMNADNIFNCYLVVEKPIALLKGNKTLDEFGIRNGSKIMYKRG